MKIIPHDILGEVNIPSSKSVLHREIILSSLGNKATRIYCTGIGKDITHTIDCLNALGAAITVSSGYIDVLPIITPKNDVLINVGESGSTLRFLIPTICSLGIRCTIDGDKSIKDRPIKPIIDLLKENGIKVIGEKLPITIEGKLQNKDYVIDGSLSSQFATGMLIALSNIKGNSSLEITNLSSSDYVNITYKCLKDYGVNIKKLDKYYIQGKTIDNPNEIVCEGDWSSAAFIMALGVLNGKTTIKNLDINSLQGDKIIVDVLRQMGARIDTQNGLVTSHKSNLNGITFSVKDYPDLAPILAVLMASAEGESKLLDVDRLKIKESDRLSNIIKMLTNLNIKTNYKNNTLTIHGGNFTKATLYGENDHRMAIASIVALSIVGGEVLGVECMDKSYPTFIDDFKNIGGYFE